MNINFKESSTKRGLVWFVGSIVSLFFYWHGHDPMPVITVTGSLAGALGIALKG